MVPLAAYSSNSWLKMFVCLRFGRLFHLMRKLTKIGRGANYVRITTVMVTFVLMAHWLGLIWYEVFKETITRGVAVVWWCGGVVGWWGGVGWWWPIRF